MRAPNKLWTTALAASIAAVLVTSACGSNSGSGGDGVKNADGSVTLTWDMWASGTADRQVWQDVANAVTAKYPNIHINLETTTFSDYFTKMGTKMAGGTAPCLVSMQSRRIAGYTHGMFPLDDLIHKNNLDSGDFDTTILKGLSGMDGHQYALPYDYGPSIVWYNSDLFQQDGVPAPKVGWTVADFMAAAKATTRDGKYGIAPYPDDTLFPLVLSWTGGTPVSSSGQLQLTTPQMVQGVQQVADMVAKDKDSPQIPGVNSTWSQDQFESGNVAMYVSGPWDASDLKAKTKFHFAPATIPAGPAGMHTDTAGSGFGISKACKDPDDAFKALSVMTSKETLAKLGQQGRAFPARRSVQDSWYQNANLPGAKDVLDAANASAQALPHTKNWAQVGNLLAQYGIAAFNGQSTVASALQQVQSQGSQGS